MELDPRVVQVSIEVNGQLKTYEYLEMLIVGTKFANSNQNECEVKISNLDKQTQDYILSETSPFNLNRTPKLITVNAGRVSYGTARIFTGNIVSAVPSQPPDIAITLKCLASNYQKGTIVSRNNSASSTLSGISNQIASDLGIGIDFQAADKNIANYNFSGTVLKQVDKLEELSNINAYIDNDVLYVKDKNVPLANRLKILNLNTGMIGIPEITEQGIKVKFLLDNQTTLGGALQVQSVIYPAVNGNYTIYKLGFEIASRDTPFYWIAEATRQ